MGRERLAPARPVRRPGRPDLPAPFVASPAVAMRLFLADLRERYGSVPAYVTEYAGVPQEQVDAMRAHLLTRR